MNIEEMEKLEESYFDAARHYGIPKHYLKAIARKVVYGKSASEIIELAFSKKNIGNMNLPDETVEEIAKIRQYIYHEIPSRCTDKDWKGFRDY